MVETESDVDDIFDFEITHAATPKKRRKVIGLDDILNDLKEEGKGGKKKSKGTKARKHSTLDDDDDDDTETKLLEAVGHFQQKIKEFDGQNGVLHEHGTEDDFSSWGLQVFGSQRTQSPLVHSKLGDSMLSKAFMSNKLNLLVELHSDRGETFFTGLLLNGWLSKLVFKCGCIEEAIAIWTFNLLSYSSEESLRSSACDFWCAILLFNEVDAPPLKFEWLPSYSELKRALESFGYLFHSPTNISSDECLVNINFERQGPPSNIRAWIKFTNACCQVRSRHHLFSVSEAEMLTEVIICLLLDRRLQCLSTVLYECMMSAIRFFTEEEWNTSCERVANALAGRVPHDSNCLRLVECISGVDTRGKQLKSVVAFQVLKTCFHEEITDAQDVLRLLISTNLKTKNCDLFRTYICLVLVDNWLIFSNRENDPAIDQMWSVFLRNCSSQITNMDFRPYAQEVRNRASYLL